MQYKMNDNVLLLGNGINNITNKESWDNLLRSIKNLCRVKIKNENDKNKPFPLFYEEIFLKSENINEIDLKKDIAQEVDKITENELHELIREKQFSNIITTNYDYTLQGKKTIKNKGIIKEHKYSIFRYNIVDKTKVWHIHGECNVPNSITLGFEHYGGQLQKIRDYVVSGTHYKNKANQDPLSSKLKKNNISFESWLDLFFTKNIHIIGLAMDFVETDLWWLLTYRARLQKSNPQIIKNKITYYTPENHSNQSKNKIDLLRSISLEVKIKKENGLKYYKNIITSI